MSSLWILRRGGARRGMMRLSEDEFALLLTVPFAFTAEQIGPAFPESFKDEIVEIRKQVTGRSSARMRGICSFADPRLRSFLPRVPILENAALRAHLNGGREQGRRDPGCGGRVA